MGKKHNLVLPSKGLMTIEGKEKIIRKCRYNLLK